MLSYQIGGVREGTLEAEKDGLYWRITARCSRDWDFPIRLLAETACGCVTLGVPQPDGAYLQLQTRLSDRSCPLTEQTRIITDQTADEPEEAVDEQENAPGEQEAIPFEPEKPFDRISEFSVMHVVEQDGKTYWQPTEAAQ